ncbi:unnamed protein product [Caenorhabditis sp. 36 PRJEB53466]|nr:unnamed protein product [Caenorhabditis sp. 36 PRJEB53466]
MSVLIIGFLSFFAIYVAHFYWKVRKYPKGPLPLPVFGNLLQFPSSNIHQWFDELSKTYGPCYTIWSPLPNVVLTDYEHVKNAMVTQADTFIYRSHRPPETLLQKHENTGVLFSDGDEWKMQRRTSLKILRDFGLGRNLMEEQVLRSVQELLTQLKTLDQQKDVDLFWPIQLCVGNVINESLFGFHYNYTAMEKFQNFVRVVDKHLKAGQGRCALLIAAFPWMKYLPVIGEIGYHSLKRNISEYLDFIEEEVDAQMKVYDEDAEPENFVHAYLQQTKKSEMSGLNMKNLVACVLDFWLAGMETTSNSLRWHIAYMMKYPELQAKVRKEIMDNIGTARLPSMADKANMPFTQAVIHEVQRHSNMIPMLASHICKEETTILGQKIPADTNIYPQIWSIMRNDKAFDSSLSFHPDRYLNADGKTFNKAVLEKTIPFSVGKRNCVGEGLARMELFLIFTALLQKYEFVPTSEIDLEPVWGGVLTVKPYTCRLIPQY